MLKVLKSRLKIVELAREWRFWVFKISEAAEKLLGKCEVYVFGSVVEGKVTGGSDIDILIVSDKVPKRLKDVWKLKTEIEELSQLPLYHPFEIHLVGKREAKWYFRHIKKYLKIR